jgi:AraC-like DNA-binding protein
MELFSAYIDTLIYWLLAVGTTLPFIMAVASWVHIDSGIEYKMAGLVLIGIGITNCYLVAIDLQLQLISNLIFVSIPFVIFSCGPAMLLAERAFFDAKFKIRPKLIVHFVIPVLASIAVAVDFLTTESLGLETKLFNLPPPGIVLAGYIYSLAYGVIAIFKLSITFKQQNKSAEFKQRQLFSVMGGIGISVMAVVLGGILIVDVFSPLLPVLYTAVSLIIAGLAYVRYPETFRLALAAIEAAPYRQSSIPESLLETISLKTQRLMEKEKRYREPGLTLRDLAGEVGVTPHQLSEYLNLDLGTSFTRYVNGLRVEEIKVTLIEKPSRPILDIAMEAGFNSKTTFNTVFAEITGGTPSAWRRANKKQPSST